MRSSTLPWRLSASLGLLLLCQSVRILAGPTINVALKASFDAGPYLLELLETAASENSTSYFPLLDSIADGVFIECTTEQTLFEKFVKIIQEDGHIQGPEALSSFKFALALRSSAPRIQAHYQYYSTSVEPNMVIAQDAACPVWVHFDGKQYCSPSLERAQQSIDLDETLGELPFDRVLNTESDAIPSILYADITHPLFGEFHHTVSKTAKEGKTSYRLRYRRPSGGVPQPLYVNGYGVELVLKRTDYIVIDDREAAANKQEILKDHTEGELLEDDPSNLTPLTTTELSTLGLNAASFIMNSEDPFDTLLKVSGNFPKYSSIVAGHNATEEFVREFKNNRAIFLPQGYNALWINGARVEERQVNAFSLLENLKKERGLINQLRDVGFSGTESIKLLSHHAIAQAQANDEPQRYDWRDVIEDGQVIMWLNDIEKDSRYQAWPTQLASLLQRTYPGQLPTVRRDIHNLIVPVDMANLKDLEMISGTIQSFVKRTVPVRFGMVPTLGNDESIRQAKLAYHILETYGLATLFSYIESLVAAKKISTLDKSTFMAAIQDRKIRQDQEALTYEAVLESEDLVAKLQVVQGYLDRLAINGKKPPLLLNGFPILRNDNWLDAMSSRVTQDLRSIQRAVFEDVFTEESWLPSYFLTRSTPRRNALIMPEDPKSVKIVDVYTLLKTNSDAFDILPLLPISSDVTSDEWVHLLVIADMDSTQGQKLLEEAISAQSKCPGLEIVILHHTYSSDVSSGFSSKLYDLFHKSKEFSAENRKKGISEFLSSSEHTPDDIAEEADSYWRAAEPIVELLGLQTEQHGLWLNGRLIVFPNSVDFTASDIETFVAFERFNRIGPVTAAINDLSIQSKIAKPLDLARITSLVARAHISDVPEGIFEANPLIRTNHFQFWNGTYSSIHQSNPEDPSIEVVALIDPASEMVQHWLPILKVLSKLHGVDVKIYMNPRDRLSELPVKRFYRQLLDSTPVFDSNGALKVPKAIFSGIPTEALLTLGMDVPPSWLVAPESCSYDLDNIKLSSLPPGQNIEAVYELENILIEGHSRDVTMGPPPRGVQLLLGTEKQPHFVDTIIMANLGYFQFKANPGYWHLSLHSGRSSKIFKIDSAGTMGYAPQPGDETNSVALLSFQGTTLFPRLSRKPGMEYEDVLETVSKTVPSKMGSAMDYLNKGASFASSALSSVGLKKASSASNADINIFSVASGHLYERMLNIMILSVMKHTSHTVKFWFIEQFLSPSFKSFLPHLAAHYNFQYEMVTYKWPHWLRAQKEKQREIWGYKILFLDVLFPLSLEKVIFVDADQIVRTDMMELNKVDLHGAPYGFTPMCDSRSEMEGFRFWKQGYWKTYLQGKPYHISALYVVDLKKFRELAAGDRLRQQYHALSADPESLSNLDQDLPNHMQHNLPIHSLPQEWLWCETWCSDESLADAKTIDLCNNPMTKEPKLDRARRQVPEWTVYDEEIAEVARKVLEVGVQEEKIEESQGNQDLSNGQGTRRKDEL